MTNSSTWASLFCVAVVMLALWAGTKMAMREWERKHPPDDEET